MTAAALTLNAPGSDLQRLEVLQPKARKQHPYPSAVMTGATTGEAGDPTQKRG